jgi:hypothetical protein
MRRKGRWKGRIIMKKLNKVLFAAAVIGALGLAGQVSGQSQLSGEAGIAASPKVREQIEGSNQRSSATVEIVLPPTGYAVLRDGPVAGSPKEQEFVEKDGTARVQRLKAPPTAGYIATGDDGITASPKLRELFDEHLPR